MVDQAQTAKKCGQAKVEWWNRTSMYVRCPTCEEVHLRGFPDDYTAVHRRTLTAPTIVTTKLGFHSVRIQMTSVTRLLKQRAPSRPAALGPRLLVSHLGLA